MKLYLAALAVFAVPFVVFGQKPSPEISALEKAAMAFVTAYNAQNSEAISELFTDEGELSDLLGEERISGRKAIKDHYDDVFSSDETLEMALEVESVRLVAENIAIEDGIVHLTPEGENEPPRSSAYTAVLLKKGDSWQIASTRRLSDATEAAGQLTDLAKALNGEWTAINANGVRLDLALGWDETGKFLTGDLLVSSADTPPQQGKIRIAWNAARNSIVSWFFDVDGGASQGTWTATEDGWLVRSEGTTAQGETTASIMEIARDEGALVWKLSNRIVDSERLPDASLRLNPPAPAPKSSAN
ncbi:MAG: SgcJ/EcaC family oxidoreductase [Akkermansiaceae bacterium]